MIIYWCASFYYWQDGVSACFEIPGNLCLHVSMQVLREHREPLLTCLKSFLHDPLVKWVESKSSVEVENPYAKDAILTIEGRLLGKLIGVKSERSSTLSCEGHADALVREATSHTNLANMYVWWMPWL